MDNNEAQTTIWTLITDAWAEDAQRMINAAKAEDTAYAIRTNPNRPTPENYCHQCGWNQAHPLANGCFFDAQPYTAEMAASRTLNKDRRSTIQGLSDRQRVEVLMTLMSTGSAAAVQRAIDDNPIR